MKKEVSIGATFKRKKYVLGLQSGSEKIHLRLTENESSLVWKPVDGQKTATKIDVADIKAIRVNGDKGFAIESTKGGTILDLEADTEDEQALWVTNLQLLCEDGEVSESTESNSRFRQMIADRAQKQAYWAQRTQELEDRKREAEERKQKFAGAGMKYTAIAMSNRASKSND
ncbi:hypothetical protein PINS_up015192 [Pythium insidiosum]|nr:hypothetical protein PINS_up015192 [Pythium insidiosum]